VPPHPLVRPDTVPCDRLPRHRASRAASCPARGSTRGGQRTARCLPAPPPPPPTHPRYRPTPSRPYSSLHSAHTPPPPRAHPARPRAPPLHPGMLGPMDRYTPHPPAPPALPLLCARPSRSSLQRASYSPDDTALVYLSFHYPAISGNAAQYPALHPTSPTPLPSSPHARRRI